MIPAVLALVVIAAVVCVAVYTGVLGDVRNRALRFFPIHSVEDIKRDIVEMTEAAPPDATVRLIDQQAADYLANGDGKLPVANGVLSYMLKYKSGDDAVQGFLCLPDDYLDKEYPVLIYNRGGNNSGILSMGQLSIDTPYSVAKTGFIILATQYRGWGSGSGKDEFGGGDVQDVITLIDLAERFTFSNGKIYMFGGSRGAMETYIVLSRDHRIDAAVAVAGMTDLRKSYQEREDGMKSLYVQTIGGTPEQMPDEYQKRSAIYWADKIDTPLLIAQGTDDWRVPMHHSVDLYHKMKDLGKDVELKLYEGEDHETAIGGHMGTYLKWLLEH